MSNTTATLQILQALEYTESRASAAEQAFDRANSEIQRKASRTIDLFGGHAGSTVADIARDVRVACDDLFSAYQSLIVMLDETCRPLLSEDPDVSAVKAVANRMKKLNEDSEIGSTFNASLNGADLGDVAGSRYVPSMNCKMIQRYWEDRYETWPGRAEQEAAARKQAEEAADKEFNQRMERYEQQMQKYREDMQEYRQAYAKWESETQKIKQMRDTELKTRQAGYEKSLRKNIEDRYVGEKQELMKRQKQLEEALKEAQETLAGAGFFAFGVKRNAKRKITELGFSQEKLRRDREAAELAYKRELADIPTEMKTWESGVKAELERKHPLPKAPAKPIEPTKPTKPRPAATGAARTSVARSVDYGAGSTKQAILDSMFPGEKYTVTDIILTCPEVADMTNQRVAALLRQMTSEGSVIRTEDGRKAYFELP
ncbi:MAG: hypothetical protein IKU07_09375 [Oscillospiraceae bacterium]|nr:hypothetical protein [Oscillospiraceae bacterium]